MDFVDRILTCTDCGGQFIFTAGEQFFFLDKQFKNDPKRCKPCKSRRGAQGASATTGSGPAAAGISRTETRTECSECGIETTVPFKPTQGRPVLCRQCYKNNMTASPTAAEIGSPTAAQTASPTAAETASTPETIAASDLATSNSSAPAAIAAEARRQPPQPELPTKDVSIAI